MSTVADGQQLATPGELNFAVARDLLAGIITVTDDEVISAMRFLFERMKLVVEPSGASALAALLAGKLDVRGLRVGVTLSGGNIDAARFASLMTEAQPAADEVASSRTSWATARARRAAARSPRVADTIAPISRPCSWYAVFSGS